MPALDKCVMLAVSGSYGVLSCVYLNLDKDLDLMITYSMETIAFASNTAWIYTDGS